MVAVLSIAGNQVPIIPFVEEDGKVNVPPKQMGAIGLNVGVVDGLTTTVVVEVAVHAPKVVTKV